MLNRMRRIAAFQNPEFYKKQGMRLSTALTPRVICCAEEEIEHVALPRGCLADLRELLSEHDSQLVIEDKRTDGQPLDVRFRGTLTAEQQRASDALDDEEIGVLVAGRELTSRHCEAEFGVTRPTTSSDFKKLVELGLAERLGAGRSTRYRLKGARES